MSVGVHDGNEDGHRLVLNQLENEVTVARGDVSQTPDGLKLKLGAFSILAKLEEARDQVAIDSLLDRWVRLERQELSETGHCENLHDLNVA